MELGNKGFGWETDLGASEVESTPQPLIGLREMMAEEAGVDDHHEEREEHLLPATRNMTLDVGVSLRFRFRVSPKGGRCEQ